MKYEEALLQAMTNKDLIREYDRLFNSDFTEVVQSISTGGLNYRIDLATGRIKGEILKFDKFFYEHIWLPLSLESLNHPNKQQR